jgi:ABC-2 type transport system ATP-binding protein
LTTHYLEEAERLCDRVALIVKSRIVALDTVDGLKAQVQGQATVEVIMASADGREEQHRFVGDDVAAAIYKALTAAEGQPVVALNTVRPTLEDAFIELTGLSAEVMKVEKGNR